jgi:pyruvate/2-oxoglutarate dehydrogenase complex dihydrolipoamide dehydrogenase (E3) component
MGHDYDVCVIGLGPAGMAVSVMAAEMGLRVVGIEKRSLGGECMSVGCIPSKALLKMAHARHLVSRLPEYALSELPAPAPTDTFGRIADHLRYIDEKKTRAMFEKVHLVLREGPATFVDPHTVTVAGKAYSAKRIFLCVGSRPAVPPIPGLGSVEYLTNENLFSIDKVPESLVILGGGAIGCEMAQAFRRLGSRVSIVHMDEHLLPHGDWEAGRVLEGVFASEGIEVLNGRKIGEVASSGGSITVRTNVGETLRGERLLVAAGRRFDFSELGLDRAGVEFSDRGIRVDTSLRTTARHIYAPGDANGVQFLSHAAMHQGMLALINSFVPRPFRRNFRSYVVPWTVFTEPQVAHVGWLERDLKANDMAYEVIETKYEDYGAAIAEGIAVGSVRVYASPSGRIYGARIIGDGAGEMINEWGLAIQTKLRLHRIMFLQHSFPSMSFLTKRASESWAMNRMKSPVMRRLAKLLA